MGLSDIAAPLESRGRASELSMRNLIKRIFPQDIKNQIKQAVLGYHSHAPSFSSAGEDMILRHLIGCDKRQGFYVDVGAHHPIKASNTYFFYLQGWRGLNIDACPGSMAEFRKTRPRDINIEVGISDVADELTYYIIEEGSPMNSFSRTFLEELDLLSAVKKEIRVPVRPLAEVLATHISTDQNIDFMTVDVEGFDLNVLRSNDWQRFRPNVLVVEDRHVHGGAIPQVVSFVNQQGYEVVAKNVIILDKIDEYFFVDRRCALAHH
jgi:FkbM family methyltransferase